MKKLNFMKRMVIAGSLFFSAAAMAQTFNFDPQETKEFAAFLKQPSMEAGKSNAEVLGIGTSAQGFSWDDPNTWKNAEGVAFTGDLNGVIKAPWGVSFSGSAEWKGKAYVISWTARADSKDDFTPSADKLLKLSGKFVLTKTKLANFKVTHTNIDSIAVEMQFNADKGEMNGTIEATGACYLQVLDNVKLKQLDLSNSTGFLRQIDCYRNALEGPEGLKMENICQKSFLGGPNKDIKLFYFGQWRENAEKNLFTYSTFPDNPCRPDLMFGSYDAINNKVIGGYKDQHASGLPIGNLDKNGNYQVAINEIIDLSAEYQPKKSATLFTWKDADGDPVTPTRDRNGMFSFNESFIGQTVKCELTNADYPMLTIKTVPVTIVAAIDGIGVSNAEALSMGPNPVNDQLIINSGTQIRNISIYSLTGSQLIKAEYPDSRIDVSSLNAGIYMVKVTTETAEKTMKIVKK